MRWQEMERKESDCMEKNQPRKPERKRGEVLDMRQRNYMSDFISTLFI